MVPHKKGEVGGGQEEPPVLPLANRHNYLLSKTSKRECQPHGLYNLQTSKQLRSSAAFVTPTLTTKCNTKNADSRSTRTRTHHSENQSWAEKHHTHPRQTVQEAPPRRHPDSTGGAIMVTAIHPALLLILSPSFLCLLHLVDNKKVIPGRYAFLKVFFFFPLELLWNK